MQLRQSRPHLTRDASTHGGEQLAQLAEVSLDVAIAAGDLLARRDRHAFILCLGQRYDLLLKTFQIGGDVGNGIGELCPLRGRLLFKPLTACLKLTQNVGHTPLQLLLDAVHGLREAGVDALVVAAPIPFLWT